jgi:hypothetical protein
MSTGSTLFGDHQENVEQIQTETEVQDSGSLKRGIDSRPLVLDVENDVCSRIDAAVRALVTAMAYLETVVLEQSCQRRS